MAQVMVNIQSAAGAPSMEAIKQRFGLSDAEIDPAFGVVAVDPEAGLFTVRVDERAAGKLGSTADWTIEGPYSNPRIAPFDLTQSGDRDET